MSGQLNRVYSFYNQKCGLGPRYFPAYLDGKVCAPQPKLTFYYRLTISPSDPSNNASFTIFETGGVGPTSYRGIENRYMVESDFVTYNKNLLTIIGFRTPSNTDVPAYLQVPPLYTETVAINTEPYNENFIKGGANYVDSGSGFATTLPYVDYAVDTATGIFGGFKNIRIIFYNNGDPPGYTGLGPVRIVEIT